MSRNDRQGGDSTRELLLDTAKRIFAERGFYGASIAQIASELGMTKQALLYHFRRKEDLYGEVLARISTRLESLILEAEASGEAPDTRLEEIFVAIFEAAVENPEDSRLLIRELLENPERAADAKAWFLIPFLAAIQRAIRGTPGLEDVSDDRALCFLYQTLGGIEYFAISRPTLESMYGTATYAAMRARFADELRAQVRRFRAMPEGV